MAKHRRFSDKPKDKPSSHQTPDILESDPNTETVQDFSATSQKTSKDFKSIVCLIDRKSVV